MDRLLALLARLSRLNRVQCMRIPIHSHKALAFANAIRFEQLGRHIVLSRLAAFPHSYILTQVAGSRLVERKE